MIYDLQHTQPDATQHCQVCIIGAGIAGLILARRLRQAKREVIVLESGPRFSDGVDHPLNEVETDGRPYLGATVGRARGVGGTSSKWGGALIPFLPEDFDARPEIGRPGWPVAFADVAAHIPEIEALFEVPAGGYGEEFLGELKRPSTIARHDGDILPRFAKWPGFGRRNIALLLRETIENDGGLRIWVNATVTAFKVGVDGAVLAAGATNAAGKRLEVKAQRFVLAAGAIESTRLALLLQRESAGHAFHHCEALGKGFHDHVSLPAAKVAAKAPLKLNRLAGFRFHHGAMRSARFELSPAAQKAEQAPSSFGHISFRGLRPSGFDGLRDALRGFQANGRLNLKHLAAAAADAPYLLHAAKWRFIDGQLLWPQPSEYHLHVVAEQLPASKNTVSLSGKTDALGAPMARVSWHVGEEEFRTVQAFARRFDAYWTRRGYGELGDLEWDIDLQHADGRFPEGGADIYHPGGSTAMAGDPRRGVVDGNLNVFGVRNLYICSTSAFPTGASANPTLMLMAFAARLGHHLSQTNP